MIATKLYDGARPYLYHRVTGFLSEEDVATGMADAYDLIRAAVWEFSELPLLVDLRGHVFASVEAHRSWSAALRKDELVNQRITRVALVGENTPTFQMEKTWLAGENLLFFDSLEEARAWIQSPI